MKAAKKPIHAVTTWVHQQPPKDKAFLTRNRQKPVHIRGLPRESLAFDVTGREDGLRLSKILARALEGHQSRAQRERTVTEITTRSEKKDDEPITPSACVSVLKSGSPENITSLPESLSIIGERLKSSPPEKAIGNVDLDAVDLSTTRSLLVVIDPDVTTRCHLGNKSYSSRTCHLSRVSPHGSRVSSSRQTCCGRDSHRVGFDLLHTTTSS
ncbi:hypothetical protein Bca4012_028555 [Brassica carinata]